MSSPEHPPAASAPGSVAADFPLAEARPHNGTPTLFIENAPVSAFAYVGDVTPLCEAMGKVVGMRFSSFVSRVQYAFYPDQPDRKEAEQRIAEHDELVRRIVRVWPEVLFFPRLQMETPTWWAERYPAEVTHYDAGGGDIRPIISPKHGVPSWASQIWREQTAAALTGYIEHLRVSGLAAHFAGFHLAAGTSAEWMSHGANAGLFVDYSAPGQKHFREWLRNKYKDVQNLRATWNDHTVTFETAAIPTHEQRTAFEGSYLLDPASSQQVIDYSKSFSDQTAETIALMARTVKDATRRRSFVGAFYGYVLQLCNEQRQQNAGHNSIDTLLNCPDLDFMASPAHYGNRRIGEGYASFMTPTESVRLHGKLWYSENDFISPLSPRGAEDCQAKTVEQYAEVLNFAHAGAITNGAGQWLLSFNQPWYHHPKLWALLARHQEIEREALNWDRQSVNEVAVIVDDESQLYQPAANVLPEFKRESASEMLIYDLPPRVGRCGTGVDWVLLDDLDKLRPYKFYIVLNALALDQRKRALLEWRLCRGGATVLWMWAPGAIEVGGTFSAENVSNLVGMRVRMSPEQIPVRVQFEKTAHPLLRRSMEPVESMGNDHAIAPHFWIDDPQATVLARFAANHRTAVAVRRFEEWTSVFVGTPLTLDENFIRELARSAGAHIYYEGPDATYVGNGLVGIHAAAAGTKRIRLPYKAAIVRELYTNRQLPGGTDLVELPMEQFQTMLVRYTA